jgi:hypothetical protein
MPDRETLYFVNISLLMKRLFPTSLVFELFSFVLLSSSMDMMVDHHPLIVACLL